MARLSRLGQTTDLLTSGDSAVDAQVEAGFDSGNGFHAAVTSLLGETPTKLRGKNMLKANWIETPIGPKIDIADAHALHFLEFLECKELDNEITKLQADTCSTIVFGLAQLIEHRRADRSGS